MTMIAWIRPLQYESSGSHGIIMNKEDSYEMGIEDGSGKFQDAFGNDDQRSCWRWFGNIRMPLHEWCKHFHARTLASLHCGLSVGCCWAQDSCRCAIRRHEREALVR